MMKQSKTTSPKKLFEYDCVTLYLVLYNLVAVHQGSMVIFLGGVCGTLEKKKKKKNPPPSKKNVNVFFCSCSIKPSECFRYAS